MLRVDAQDPEIGCLIGPIADQVADSEPETDLKVAATAFGAGILLDATIVRGLLVPALVAAFGNWNWWLPAWALWLQRVPARQPR